MASPAIPRVNGIPLLGYGTWPLKGDVAMAGVSMALEVGFRHIDTAQIYGNEAEVGQAIRQSGLARDELYIVSKLAPETDPGTMADAIAASVERIGAGPIDLMLIHWPTRNAAWFDAALAALNAAQDEGLLRGIGLSNCNVALMEHAVARSRHRILANQVEFHPLISQRKLVAAAHRLGILLEAYCPLARGAVLADPIVTQIAQAHGVAPATVVLCWIMAQNIAAIPMTTKPANALANIAAVDLRLSPQELQAVGTLASRHQRLISPQDWAPQWDEA